MNVSCGVVLIIQTCLHECFTEYVHVCLQLYTREVNLIKVEMVSIFTNKQYQEMFEDDFTDMCATRLPLMLMGGQN